MRSPAATALTLALLSVPWLTPLATALCVLPWWGRVAALGACPPLYLLAVARLYALARDQGAEAERKAMRAFFWARLDAAMRRQATTPEGGAEVLAAREAALAADAIRLDYEAARQGA